MSPDWNEQLQTKHGVNRLHHWKKGNQRNTLLRKHAELAVKDTQLVQAFVHACGKCTVRWGLASSFSWSKASLHASLESLRESMCLPVHLHTLLHCQLPWNSNLPC